MEDIIRKKPSLWRRVTQCLVVAFFVLLALVLIGEVDKLSIPGAPKAWFVIAIILVVLWGLIHCPPLFFRLPSRIRTAAWAGILPVFFVVSAYFEQMTAVYNKTPQGAKELAERRKEEAHQAEEAAQQAKIEDKRVESEKLLARLEESKEQAEDLQERLEGCFSGTDHQLPGLSETVKNNLHNPAAFEHVETILIVPDQERHNVVMTFRAENGFGAIRTAQVRASLYADGCEVDNLSEPEVS